MSLRVIRDRRSMADIAEEAELAPRLVPLWRRLAVAGWCVVVLVVLWFLGPT